MPGQIKRPYTSYETRGYDIYPSDVYENDQNGYLDDRIPSPPPEPSARYGAYTPQRGRATPGSQCGRPFSRVNHGTQDYLDQTDSRLGYNNDFRYPSPPPAMRLQREMTMPVRTDQPLDPFTRQYYNRIFKTPQTTDVNLNRMGRAGGRWRHVTSCYSNTGAHMSFVEGTVKEVDNDLLLPRRQPVQRSNFSKNVAMPPTTYRAPSANRRKPKHQSVYYDHAKNGFRYWYQEPNKPMDLAPSLRIAGLRTGEMY